MLLQFAGRVGYLPRERYSRESLLLSAHSTAGVLSAFGWISAAGRSVDRCSATDGSGAAAEATFPETYYCWDGLQLLAGFSAECGPGGGAFGMGGCSRIRANGAELSGNAFGCGGGPGASTQARLQNIQRLHDRAAQRIAVWMLSSGRVLQEVSASHLLKIAKAGK